MDIGNKLDKLIPVKRKTGELIKKIRIEDIIANENQPRKTFDKKSLESLADSIKEFGLIQPITVSDENGKYTIIAGERRFRAAKLVGLKEIDAIVKEIEDREAAKIALVENLQRENLNPIDEAAAYKYMKEQYQVSQEELSKIVGKSRSQIANSLRLLTLEDYIQVKVMEEKISGAHARTLLSFPENQRKEILTKTINEGLSVRELENLSKIKKENKTNIIKKEEETAEDEIIKSLEKNFEMKLGTKVRIDDKGNKGKIIIEYYNLDDFDRIKEIIEGK